LPIGLIAIKDFKIISIYCRLALSVLAEGYYRDLVLTLNQIRVSTFDYYHWVDIIRSVVRASELSWFIDL